MAEQIFEIPEGRLARLAELFGRIEKTARKLAVPVPTYTVIGHRDIEIEVLDGELILHKVTRRLAQVRIAGETPMLAGWTFIGTIEHLSEAGNVLRAIPGESFPPEYRTTPPICEHCHLVRRRIDTYVVRHSDGRVRQVGSGCLADFTGGLSPEHAIMLAGILIDAGAAGDECSAGGHVEPTWSMATILEVTAGAVRARGWTSRERARTEGRAATADDVFSLLCPPRRADRTEAYNRWAAECEPTEDDKARALAALQWAEALADRDDADLSDYLHNCRVLVSTGIVTIKQLGLACSIFTTAERELGIARERARTAATSAHVGTVGKRLALTLTVLRIIEHEGRYGCTHIHKLADAAGNQFVWFGTSNPLEPGETYSCKATVKEHSEYQGIKQTVVTRLAVV